MEAAGAAGEPMTLAHREAGAGAPIVLLHAFPLSGAMWQETLTQCGLRARVLAPDLPGFGRSARAAAPSIGGMADAVLEWLDETGVREPVVLGGLSMGGYVAFELVRRAADRVRALVLCSTRATADTPEQRQGRRSLISRIEREGLSAALAGMLPKLLGPTSLQASPRLVEQVRGWIGQADRDGIVDALRAMADRRDATATLPSLRCPALVVAGGEDALILPAAAEAMARALPAASLEVIPQAGHLVNLEQPARFHGALSRFLSAVRS